MSISVKWLNEAKTILLWLAEGEVTQQDRDTAEMELYQFRQSVNRRIGIIRDERNGTIVGQPTGVEGISRIGGTLIPDAHTQAPMPVTAYVVQPGQVDLFNQTFSHISDQFKVMFPDADENIVKAILNTMKATSSLEDAIAWINEALADTNEE